ncbi:hypothetical protein PRIPAC_85689 [Pristionchus pacificus]|nr:hypothetical protein PRIPAC_85689 [Pristionchus pacificus]
MNLRNRLFTGIKLTSFSINWPDNASVDFVWNFTEKFKIESFTIFVSSENLLRIACQIMVNFPSSKFTMYLYFLPEPEIVLSFPPMESLHIKDCSVGIIASHSKTRIVQVQMDTSTIKNWLSLKGIERTVQDGDLIGKFEIVNKPYYARNVRRAGELVLRYEDRAANQQCTIRMPGSVWNYGNVYCRMHISNR